jgi:hypothetical protein
MCLGGGYSPQPTAHRSTIRPKTVSAIGLVSFKQGLGSLGRTLGEDRAIMLSMARCRVSYSDSEGNHSVEVNSETLYEAVAMAVADFKQDTTVSNPPGLETDFTVLVLRKPIEHVIRLKQIHEWATPSTKGGPAKTLKRERVRRMLAGEVRTRG